MNSVRVVFSIGVDIPACRTWRASLGFIIFFFLFPCSSYAECTQITSYINCVGNTGPINYTAPPISSLSVSHITSNISFVNLTGEATASGQAGPDIEVNISLSGPFIVSPGGVIASSYGASGANGTAASVLNIGSDGVAGANGGSSSIEFAGNSFTTSGDSGVSASSIAGSGGDGGASCYGCRAPGNGGAGGNGGLSTVVVVSNSKIETLGNNIVGVGSASLGGAGGAGGNDVSNVASPGHPGLAGEGGNSYVTTYQNTSITTSGSYSHGIQALSLGGAGNGSGSSFGLFYASGGSGGSGGNANNVVVMSGANIQGLIDVSEVLSGGTITTLGPESNGILAQSIGGGGGAADTASGLVVLGSNGGVGGKGGEVSVSNASKILTVGSQADGILAQSIGGGGGIAMNTQGGISFGGGGGAASSSSSVNVSNFGEIIVKGDKSNAIVAQSIGGGGGVGANAGGIVSFGGAGGLGAKGDSVSVLNAGNITAGNATNQTSNSVGILAQSIGGGGGNGGGSIAASADILGLGAVSASFGGNGGAGGDGNDISIQLDNEKIESATGYQIITYGDDSDAIVAQSIGGGGGNGGYVVAASLAAGFAVAIGRGGDGGIGGVGAKVNVTTKGALLTNGDNSSGILAQSIGGGGGNGGFSVSASVGFVGAASFSIGGKGGTGGRSDEVSVVNASNISTVGKNSIGVIAQSIGGGGGNAGLTLAQSVSFPAVSASFGADAGSGGNSGDVSITNENQITTKGDNSIGLLAQSIGGGGGNAGLTTSGTAALIGAVSLGFGGSGSAAGNAGKVILNNSGLINTLGKDADGIIAQSIGGGGGNGGSTIAAGGALYGSVSTSLGGNGGTAGNGNVVTVNNSSLIETVGDASNGILVQSIGGGGGNGGISGAVGGAQYVSISASLGGQGQAGGSGAPVSITNDGYISTNGLSSNALIAQSIGGGGGNGGFAGAAGGAQYASINASLGGQGQAGGNADSVTIENNLSRPSRAALITTGAKSNGIFAQSIGGGGGDGGSAFSAGGAQFGVVNLSLGGKGDAAGSAGTVSVASANSITTSGEESNGILAQSIGGGGGNGGVTGAAGGAQYAAISIGVSGTGSAGGTGNNVKVVNSGAITTQGMLSNAIKAQSIGGGGGDGGLSGTANGAQYGSVSMSLGGQGGTGGNAGQVYVENNVFTAANETLFTSSTMSNGIIAQSIGGGGGSGGFAVMGNGTKYGAGAFSIGGAGNVGGNGGTVEIKNSNSIITLGYNSSGIIAESIGGGGGNGGFAVSGNVSIGDPAIPVDIGLRQTVGGAGAAGGVGGDVYINTSRSQAASSENVLSANIITAQNQSAGLIATSLGGGGGYGNFSFGGALSINGAINNTIVGGKGGAGGSAGNVNVAFKGNIYTGAQISGNEVVASAAGAGVQSTGILAQSIGGGGGNGGFAVGGALSLGSGATNNSIGAIAGAGSTAGAVNVTTFTGQLVTFGDQAAGIIARSIGGGGGGGGFAVGAASRFDVGQNSSISILDSTNNSIGGAGGAGGKGGAVVVSNAASINTFGQDSAGILATSIGGAGGEGSFAIGGTLSVAAATNSSLSAVSNKVGGGSGGGGSTASTVSIINTGNVSTKGVRSNGLFAQSIGGAGGDGGYAIGGSLAVGNVTSTATAGALNNAVGGGSGGIANQADKVTITNSADISTAGVQSSAISAQSIGGNGGNGSFAIGGSISIPLGLQQSALSATNTIGAGSGATGGVAGSVYVNSWPLTTDTAESVLPVTITTTQNQSNGIMATSVGGGGGEGYYAIGAGLSISGDMENKVQGGAGGAGGSAGDVNVVFNGNIYTGAALSGARITASAPGAGVQSTAILAESIGGGGGDGGFVIGGALSLNGGAINNTVGASAGSGSTAGTVKITTFVGEFVTFGDEAAGIIARSIGGGGGEGTFSIGAAFGIAAGQNTTGNALKSANNIIGGAGGVGGVGGEVDVNNAASINTFGQAAGGIIAKSVGGGGGDGGFSFSGNLYVDNPSDTTLSTVANTVGDGKGGDGGHASKVSVSNTGNITTFGAASGGILAQSIGNSGGYGGYVIGYDLQVTNTSNPAASTSATIINTIGSGQGGSETYAGDVSVTNYGTISTSGSLSAAINAQSIGGNGGVGGFAVGGKLSNVGEIVNIVGSSDANGSTGQGGKVDIVNNNSINTAGLFNIGILAQSIGGDGGVGFFSIASKEVSSTASMEQLVGDFGIGGGNSRDVNVTNNIKGFINTNATGAYGISAQSIGGGGGISGFVTDGNLNLTSNSTINLGSESLSVGGNAGAVSVINSSGIITRGADSIGIAAQSIGAGGGISTFSGGLNIANGGKLITLMGAGSNTDNNSGNSSGAASNVSVINSLSGGVITYGVNSTGILAQTIAGGGGYGANTITGSAIIGSGILTKVGGNGASENSISEQTLTQIINNAAIITNGMNSTGIVAQSIGGGGGMDSVAIRDSATIQNTGEISTVIGGRNAAQGKGGAVDIINQGDIEVFGISSAGIIEQSIGGGGGIAAIVGNIILSQNVPISFGLGSQSGSGGDGGLATITLSGSSISTTGAGAPGVITQSIGGGGGVISGAINVAVEHSQTSSITFGIANASQVILSQDVISNGGGVKLNGSGIIRTSGVFSPGLVAQTIGGGGGYADLVASSGMNSQNLDIRLGNSNNSNYRVGGSADISAVSSVTLGRGSILTSGPLSVGMMVQSIGAGGGIFGFNSPDIAANNVTSVVLGGSGNVSGEGGAIVIDSQSSILTTGIGSHGLIAQSIGGGGGAALMQGVNVSSGIASSQVSIGGVSGVAGNGNIVSITTGAPIITRGLNAYGIIAQSIGGGGGLFMGFDPNSNSIIPSITHNSGGSGDGRDVTVTVNAPINVTGDGSIGVLAQSIGGGGGYVASGDAQAPAFSGSAGGVGASGTVTINVNANIVATGFGSDAIVAQSATAAGSDTGKVAINIAQGVSVIGDGPNNGSDPHDPGAGIFMAGSNSEIVNRGYLSTINGALGEGIVFTGTNNAFVNYGTFIGSIYSGGSTKIINQASGVFDAGETIDTGTDGQFINNGLLVVGGDSTGYKTTISGDFIQGQSGSCGSSGVISANCGYTLADVSIGTGLSGELNVSGAATMSGVIVINPTDLGSAKPGSGIVKLVHANGGLSTSNLQVQAPTSAVASYSLISLSNSDLGVQYTVNFAPIGLSYNQQAPAFAVNAIQASGASPTFAPVASALFVQPTLTALGAAYNALSGEGVSASQQTTFMANDFIHSSANRQMNFWVYDQENNNTNSLTLYDDRADIGPDRKWRAMAPYDNRAPRFAERTWRAWMMGSGGALAYPGQSSTGSANISAGGYGFTGGIDRQLTPNIIIGVAGGYGTYGFGVQDRQTYGNTYGGHIAGYAALKSGAFYATGTLSGDFFSNYAQRTVSIAGSSGGMDGFVSATPGVYDRLNDKFGSRSVSGMGEAGYRMRVSTIDVTPYAALQFSSLRTDGFNEYNGYSQSVVGLNYQGRRVGSFPSYVGLQLNHNFDAVNGMPLWGWLRSSWRHEFDQLRSVTTQFLAAPGTNFTTLGAPGVRDMAALSTGLKLGITDSIALFAGFDGNFAPLAYAVTGTGGIQMSW